MLKSILRVAAFSMVRKFMGGQSPAQNGPGYRPVHPNTEAIKTLAIRYLSFSVLAFLNFLLFVGGLLITAVAIAHSFDVANQFQATSVFWTGVIIMLTGFVLTGVCGYALLHTKVVPEELLISEPQEEPLTLADRLFRPVLEGFLAGLAQPRHHHHDDQARPAA